MYFVPLPLPVLLIYPSSVKVLSMSTVSDFPNPVAYANMELDTSNEYDLRIKKDAKSNVVYASDFASDLRRYI